MPDACGGFASAFSRRELNEHSGYPVAPPYREVAWRATQLRPSRRRFSRSGSTSVSLRDYLPATDAATSCSAAIRSARQSEP